MSKSKKDSKSSVTIKQYNQVVDLLEATASANLQMEKDKEDLKRDLEQSRFISDAYLDLIVRFDDLLTDSFTVLRAQKRQLTTISFISSEDIPNAILSVLHPEIFEDEGEEEACTKLDMDPKE